MSLTGFRIEFSDGTTFRARESIDVTHGVQPLYVLDGFQQFVTIYNEYFDAGGTDGRANSNMSGVFAGFGAGVHTITIGVYQFEGNGQSWGSANTADGGDTALNLLQRLNRAVTTVPNDSDDPIKLEVGEYSDSGIYDPLDVAVISSDLTYQGATDDSEVSAFTGTMEFAETIDLTNPVSSQARRD